MVIVNPNSGGGATGRAWTGLRRGLETTLGCWDEVFTQAPNHATALARNAINTGYDQLIVVGGDGTLNEVVNGLFPEDKEMGIGTEPIRRDVRLAVVRRGTGGDFARNLALPNKGIKVFAHVASSQTISTDLGLCLFQSPSGKVCRRAFINIASFGLSGLVDQKLNFGRKRAGSLSYAGAIISALYSYKRQLVRVLVDNKPLYEGRLLLGAVANAPYFGGGIKIAPDADYSDGRLNIVLLVHIGQREVMNSWSIYSGQHIHWDSVRVARGESIEVSALESTECLLDIDGEQPGMLGATMSVVPDAVQLVLP